MTEKFTSGTWEVKLKPNGKRVVQNEHGRQICLMWNDSSVIANAHLIAAAPDMYRALAETTKELAKLIDMYNAQVKDRDLFADGQTCHENAILLSKARGEE